MAAQDSAIQKSRALARDAVAADRAGDPDRSAALFEQALELWYPRAYAAMGLTADIARSDDFKDLRTLPDSIEISGRLLDNGKARAASAPAFTLDDGRLLTEGIAFDARSGRFFVSSVHKRKIVAIDRDGGAGDFIAAGQDGIWGVFGIAVDAGRRVLWAGSGTVPQIADHPGDGQGGTGVFKFALDDGRLLGKMLITDTPGDHQLSNRPIPIIAIRPSASWRAARFIMSPTANGRALARRDPDRRTPR